MSPAYISTIILNFFPNDGSVYYYFFVLLKPVYVRSPTVKTLFTALFYCQNVKRYSVNIVFLKNFLLAKQLKSMWFYK